MLLFLALLMIPLAEIAVFIVVGRLIGLWPTLALVVLSAVVGASLIRRQGIGAISALRTKITAQDDPTGPLFDGAAILFAGALLLTPGFITDTLGLLLLSPWIRGALYRAVRKRVNVVVPPPPQRPGDVIDGDYRVVDRDPPRS